MNVHVIDAVMGSGKTSASINYMNDSMDKDPNKKFIYVTPYLEEVKRIKQQCKGFYEPVNYNDWVPKLIHLKELLNKGANIVTTHSMFSYFDDEIIDLCYTQKYELIMDEVHEVVEPLYINKTDLKMLLSECIAVDNDGIAHWYNEDDYKDGGFKHIKKMCETGSVAIYNNMALLWLFPVKIFKAFRQTWILTYMFNAQMQRYYYDYYGIEYDYWYISGNSLSTYYFSSNKIEYTAKYPYNELINILDNDKLNDIGDLDTALSKAWYQRNANNVLMENLQKNLYNFFKNRKVLYSDGEYIKSKGEYNLWTTFKDYKKILSKSGYANGYISCNMRATNDYRERTVVAYTINRYFNPVIKNFFNSHNVEVDEDTYALSEMLQFIWRSGIRDGKHITIYIPSKRMRKLFQEWIQLQVD